MNRYLYFIEKIRGYRPSYLFPDLLAGLTIAVVLIPQAMSYAMMAGLPPVYGLYAAALPPIIGALWGRSSLLATGPVAMVSLLVFTSLVPYAKPGTPEYISYAIALALMVGVIQLLMGVFKLGFLMRFVSHPVIVGFTNAAAIIIAATQVKHLLGIEVKASEFVFQMFANTAGNLGDTNFYTLGIGILAFIIIMGGRKIHNLFPGALVAAVVTTFMVYFFKLENMGVKIVGLMPSGLPLPKIPAIDLETGARLFGAAIVIAIIGFMEAMAITKSVSAKVKEKVDTDQELLGQGLSNIVGSLFQAYPVSGSFSRTAVNLQVGGKTAFSSVFSGLFVILAILFLTSSFHYLPKTALAAIVISAVIGLAQHSHFVRLFKTSRSDGSVAVITLVFAFLTKPDYAIFIGIVMSLILFLWESMKPRITVLTRHPRAEIFEDAGATGNPVCPQILYLRPDFSIYFANAEYIRENIMAMAKERKNGLKYVLIDMEAVSSIDATGMDELKALLEETNTLNIGLYIANVKLAVREILQKTGFTNLLEQTHCLNSKGESITLLFNKIDHDYCKNVCPHTVFWECETVK